jgi:hypothetical protein
MPDSIVDPHTVPYVSVEELAAYARMPVRTVYHHATKGALKTVRRGRRLYVAQAEALAYLAKGTPPELFIARP